MLIVTGYKDHAECDPGIEWDGTLSQDDRAIMEQKLSRLMSWVGERMPAEVELNGKKVPLREMVWELINKSSFTDEERSALLDLQASLMKKFKEDVADIESEAMTEDEAARHYCEALGLMRAIVSIKGLTEAECMQEGNHKVCRKINKRIVDDTGNWLNFLKEINS